MIYLVETLNFRCLRYVSRPLNDFNVLVGPNASGKTTFLDVVAFLGRLVSEGLEPALEERAANFRDLVWQGSGDRFELAVEVMVPEAIRQQLADTDYDALRYEVAIGLLPATDELAILSEKVFLKPKSAPGPGKAAGFPAEATCPASILVPRGTTGMRTLVNKVFGGYDKFHSEVLPRPGKEIGFRLGPRKSALGNLPEDETNFPASTFLKALLAEGVKGIALNGRTIRKASPPGQVRGFKTDGSNLPWVVERFTKEHPARYEDWLSHVRTALPDLEDLRTVERPDDRHRYLMLRYRGGVEVPSWVASDGTLRLLALTLPAYLPEMRGIYLIEEPENGVHPTAVEAMFRSLSSVYDAQVLLATHSPVILSLADAKSVLCFAKGQGGATAIVRGDMHPALSDWRGEPNLSVLFAAGVLG